MDIQKYLTNVCQHCGLEADQIDLNVEETDDAVEVHIQVPEEEVGLFIGHHGENLAAMQRMLRVVFHDKFPEKQIRFNINDYREERLNHLEDRAQEVAEYVINSGRSYRFPYMSSYERFVIHSAISGNEEYANLESFSQGEGRQRRLIVQLKADELSEDEAENEEVSNETE